MIDREQIKGKQIVPGESEAANEGDSSRRFRLGERFKSGQTLISFAIAIAVVGFVFRNLDLNVGEIFDNVRNANPLFVVLGFAAYYGSFPLRAARWRILLRNAGIEREANGELPGVLGLSRIYILGWFANCLVPAKLGDAYRGYLLKRDAGPSWARTVGTIVAERFIDVLALVSFMMLAIVPVFGSKIPGSVQGPLFGGVALAVLGIAGMACLIWLQGTVERIVPERVRPVYTRFEGGIVASFSRQGLPALVGITLIVWMLEGLRVWAVTQSLGIHLGPFEALFVALLASLLTVVPITPAGLGVVEGGMIIALKLLSVGDSGAASIALLDRGIAYWSIVVIGAIVYLFDRRRRSARA